MGALRGVSHGLLWGATQRDEQPAMKGSVSVQRKGDYVVVPPIDEKADWEDYFNFFMPKGFGGDYQ